MSGSEELREALQSLQLENERLRKAAAHSELQLRSLEALLSSDIEQDPFPSVFSSLNTIFDFSAAMVLAEAENGQLNCISATPMHLIGLEWHSGPFLEKVMNGRVSATFSNEALEEWQNLDTTLISPNQPAIYLPMRVRDRRGVLVLLRPAGSEGFDRDHVALAREFSLLASLALGALHASQLIEASRARAAVAEESNRTKNLFIAKMSHELRTPLNSVIGFSELLKEESFGPLGDPQYKEFSSHIHSSGKHLLDVINDIIDISRIESGAFEMRDHPFDPNDAIAACADIAEGWQTNMPRQFSISTPNHLPNIRGDARLIRQMLLNLLSNAFKFSDTDSGAVTLSARVTDDGTFELSVRDNGIGIQKQNLENLTEAFFQVDDSLSRSHEGSGLGLSLVKTIIESHDGSLLIESEPGAGTTVTVALPANRVEPSNAATAATDANIA